MSYKWLEWAKKIQEHAQIGLEYTKDKFDRERFEELRELSVEIMSEYTDLKMDKVKELFANESGYQTPKVDVRGVIVKEDKILLVRETSDNKWSLPGGWADIGLSLKENVVKESFEEAGAVVKPLRILAIFDKDKHIFKPYPYAIYKVFILCELESFNFKENLETDKAEFFSLDNLPEISSNKNTEKMIMECFEHYKNNTMYFD